MSSKEVIPAKEGAKSRARLVKVVVRKGLRTKVDRRRGRYKTKTKKQKDEDKKKKEREALKRLKGLPEFQALLKKIKANEKLIEELKKGALIKGGLGGGTATRRPPSGGSSINRAFPSSSTSTNNISINELLKQNKELNKKIDDLSKKFDQVRTQEEFKKDEERRNTEEERKKRTSRFEGPRETFRGGDDDDDSDDDDDDDIPPAVARPQRAPTRDTPEISREGPIPSSPESSVAYSEDGLFQDVFSNNPRLPHNQAQLQQSRRNQRNSSDPSSLFIRSLSNQEEPEVDTDIRPPIEAEPEVDTEIRPITLTEEDRERIQTISQTPIPDTAPEALDIDLEQRTNIEALQIRDNPATQRQTSNAPRLADRIPSNISKRRAVIETENIIEGAFSRIRKREKRKKEKLREEAEKLRSIVKEQEDRNDTAIRERARNRGRQRPEPEPENLIQRVKEQQQIPIQQQIETLIRRKDEKNNERQNIIDQIKEIDSTFNVSKSSSKDKIVELIDNTEIDSRIRVLLGQLLQSSRQYLLIAKNISLLKKKQRR